MYLCYMSERCLFLIQRLSKRHDPTVTLIISRLPLKERKEGKTESKGWPVCSLDCHLGHT